MLNSACCYTRSFFVYLRDVPCRCHSADPGEKAGPALGLDSAHGWAREISALPLLETFLHPHLSGCLRIVKHITKKVKIIEKSLEQKVIFKYFQCSEVKN